MKLVKSLLTAGLSIGLLAGCTLDKTAIVTVNGEAITKGQYEAVLNKQLKSPQLKQLGPEAKDPNGVMMLMARDRIINELIIKTLLEQQIKEHKITVTDDDMKAKKAEIIEKLGSEERLQEILKENNISENQLKEDLTNEIKVDKLVQATSDVKVSDKEISDFYNQNKASFDRPERVKAAHILIEANPDKIKEQIIEADKNGKLTAAEIDTKVKAVMDEKMATAKKVREEVAKNPEKFGELAKKYSEDKASAVNGGDLGFFPKDAMVKEFSDAAFSLKPGVVSEIVVTEFGNHIIIVSDRAAAGLQPLDKVKDEIKAYLEQQKKISALQTLFEGLRASAKIEYNDKSFSPEGIQQAIRVDIQKKQQQQQNAPDAAPVTPAN